jgi:carotenoid 1,2-hydratase
MPTLPLLIPTSVPDAAHQVTAPGGYEWWYFDAEDAANDRQIVAILFDGFVFHPGYLRAYARYFRNPTRTAPPLPSQYRCAYFVVYERGKILSQFMCQYPHADFRARTDRPDVVLGSNQFHLADDGSLNLRMRGRPWVLTWHGPKHLTSQTLAGEFLFKPRFAHAPMERTFLSRQMTGADHHWVIANPLCDVSGVIELFDAEVGKPKVIEFSGRGYHDHNYGTGPLGPGLKRWIWGRVLMNDRVSTFHFARPRDAALADEVHLVHGDAGGTREIAVAKVDADWSRRNALGLAYPAHMKLDDALELHNPRLIDSSPFYLRMIYEATCAGSNGTAFCEVAYPHRLRVPILGRMIEMSIGR